MALSHNLIQTERLRPGVVVFSFGRDFQGSQGIESFAHAYGLPIPPPTFIAVAPREEYHEQYIIHSAPEDWRPGRERFPLGRSALTIWTSHSPSFPGALTKSQTTAYAPEKLLATIPEIPGPQEIPALPLEWLHALADKDLRAKDDAVSPQPLRHSSAAQRSRVVAGVAALVALIVGFVLWQGGAFDKDDATAVQHGPSASMTGQIPSDYSTYESTDSSSMRELKAVGITESLVQQLQTTASATNYGLRRNVPLEREALEELAYVMVWACVDIADGTMTWQESIEADMSTGANRRDAETMNRFLRTSYCPSIDYAAVPN
ncbi:hypothetical protein R4P70_30800 [Rhodococcus sp. IEGM 1241]|uniref:hypothetical protein n=1 Tax=Rhodococcus sp. IEGM 1241 TaxID=3082228 RepID=UPI00295522DB|nr:hypothetical protein [Rhodococcus sp. IEGM 1241]MDV8015714.1 hypothetical protein [Rhodococcus sp. IEGM 1241]